MKYIWEPEDLHMGKRVLLPTGQEYGLLGKMRVDTSKPMEIDDNWYLVCFVDGEISNQGSSESVCKYLNGCGFRPGE